jgi:hypothetical protein
MLAFRLHREKSDSSVNRGHSLSNDSGEVELCQTIHCGIQHRIFSGVGRSFPINGPTLAHQQTKWHDHVPSTNLDYAQSRRQEAGEGHARRDSGMISDCDELQLLYADYFDTSRSSDYLVRCMDGFSHQPQFCKLYRSCLS